LNDQKIPPFDDWRAIADAGDFEAVLAALEESVALLERGGLSLAAMTDCYEIGLRLSRRCTELIRAAELRVTILDEEYAAFEASSRDRTGGTHPGTSLTDEDE
jgi:exodeoxyribonuclease VII small subunit